MGDYNPAVGAVAFTVVWYGVVFGEDDCAGACDATEFALSKAIEFIRK